LSQAEFAVLIPLLEDRVVLTRRPERESDHYSGQVCLPGGRREPEDDSLSACALRETEEEIGVSRDEIRVLDELDWHVTGYGHRVKPFVGELPGSSVLRPNPSEVEEILLLPIQTITAELFGVRGTWTDAGGKVREIFSFDLDGHEVWGLTARILRERFVLRANRDSGPSHP